MSALNTENVLRVGLVGAGDFGRCHLQTLTSLGEAQPAAVVDSDPERLASISDVPTWTDLHAALREAEVDAWIVATPTATHISIATALLDAGFPVLLEKPLAPSLAEAGQLASHVTGDSSNLMLGHIVLFNSEFRALRKEVVTRSALRHVSCCRMRSTDHLERYPGESPLFLTMVHDLYCVQALVEGAEPVTISAQRRLTDTGATDLVLAQLAFPGGFLASLRAGFVTPPGMPDNGYDRMELFGDDWAARLSSNPRPIELWDSHARSPMSIEILDDADGSVGMLAEELRCFCRVVRGQQTVPVGARYTDGMQLIRWMQALQDHMEESDAG
jgi:predicted dehydrogenase